MYPNHIPSVSIILTSYNHEKFIREAIDSVLNQTYTDFELIIWDDASTDTSWDIIQSYKDPRIRAFRNEVNERKTINKALLSGHVSGRYVAIHHSDDVWEPTKLEKQVAFLEGNPEYGAVFTQVSPISESGLPFGDTTHMYYAVFEQPNRSRHEWLRHFFTIGNALCHPSVLIRKECYATCGLYAYPLAQLPDFDMWVRLAMHYELYVLPEKLLRFRVRDHEANISGNRRDTRVRGYTEYYKVLDHFKSITAFEDLASIFPEARPYDLGGRTDMLFVLGKVGLEVAVHPFARLFCLGLLYDALNDSTRRNAIAEQYGFTYRSLIALAKDHDVFGQEELRKMSLRVWGKLVYSGLYLFDEANHLVGQYTTEILLVEEQGNTILFELDGTTLFHSFRWDPIEGSPCRVSTRSIVLTDSEGKVTDIPVEGVQHNGEKEDGRVCYYTNDPQQKYLFGGTAKQIKIVAHIEKSDPLIVEQKLSGQVFALQDAFRQYKSYSLELEAVRSSLESRVSGLEEIRSGLESRVSGLEAVHSVSESLVSGLEGMLRASQGQVLRQQEEIGRQKRQIEDLLNSWSWKLTQPVRWLGRYFRRWNL